LRLHIPPHGLSYNKTTLEAEAGIEPTSTDLQSAA
jgi:hypothetical protein